ncbi:hypothetical protein [Nostoc sp. FACHB-892]|uniref:hypothetical protein n=1 Tax=Nostoc sp. FACHB-892 TaxID=2692843 RepID=UPI00168A1598|nr:hypothetical protein [Nostoc sp. FACHB-892]
MTVIKPVFVVADCTYPNFWDYDLMRLTLQIPSSENWYRRTQWLHQNHIPKICCMILPSKELIQQLQLRV